MLTGRGKANESKYFGNDRTCAEEYTKESKTNIKEPSASQHLYIKRSQPWFFLHRGGINPAVYEPPAPVNSWSQCFNTLQTHTDRNMLSGEPDFIHPRETQLKPSAPRCSDYMF